MVESRDISLFLKLPDVIKTIGGIVLVDRPTVGMLKQLSLLGHDPRRKMLLFCEKQGKAAGLKSRLAQKGFKNAAVFLGDMPQFSPLKRRSASAIIMPLPYIEENEMLRLLRKAAGMLEDDGLLILHSPVRGRILGLGEHLVRVLFLQERGLPEEHTVVSLALRGGFNRIEKHRMGGIRPRLFILARKNTL
ncbi:MAG: hypothetical protein ABIJ56_15860 [Pseudomonadota bacterium]